jgi:4-methyl-5(b-hydroxyethyl)-thiazole monophosphate biosynthesis
MEKEPSALVILANGVEEIEAITPIDLLRRAGISVTTCSCEKELSVKGRSNISILADCLLEEIESQTFDLLILPGGPAVFELRKKNTILEIIKCHQKKNRWIGAICAAPLLLLDANVLGDLKYTAHASVANELPMLMKEKDVVIDQKLITATGVGTAVKFALALIEVLINSENARAIADSIHAPFQSIYN